MKFHRNRREERRGGAGCHGCDCPERACAHRRDGQSLCDLHPGDVGVIQWVGGTGALKRRLVDMGIVPGIQVEVIKVAPLGDPMEISIRGFSLAIRRDDAKNIGVGEWRQGCSRRGNGGRRKNCCNHGERRGNGMVEIPRDGEET